MESKKIIINTILVVGLFIVGIIIGVVITNIKYSEEKYNFDVNRDGKVNGEDSYLTEKYIMNVD